MKAFAQSKDQIVDIEADKPNVDEGELDQLGKEKVDHYKREKSEIPKMHFGVKTVEDKNWFYTIGFADQTWTDSCMAYSGRHFYSDQYKGKTSSGSRGFIIFREVYILYDSYESSGNNAAVLAEIEKIATIIPLCLQDCDFYVKKGIGLQNHPRYKDKESTDMFDVLFEDDLPQQPSESLSPPEEQTDEIAS
ncbi:hypothetical protein FXO37_02402 [Capsicum annuum]|nr:hypothetical protein FXO37_02402 [Capsicum annuum]